MGSGIDGPDPVTGPPVQAEGLVQEQGITFYQYGSHVLADASGETRFALRSSDPSMLDAVIGRRVRIWGHLVPGYPLDFGPPLIEVRQVETM